MLVYEFNLPKMQERFEGAYEKRTSQMLSKVLGFRLEKRKLTF